MSDAEAPPFAFVLPWRSQRLTFAYAIDQWRALQRELDVGPWVLEARLATRACTADEVMKALVQGLAGGKQMSLRAAEDLVAENCRGNGALEEARLVARAALHAALFKVDADLAGESSPAGDAGAMTPTPRRDSSPSPD